MKLHPLFLHFALITISSASLAQSGGSAVIKNQIKLNTDGLTVSKAYLSDEAGNEMTLNQTSLNKPIYVNLVVSGWNIKDGQVNLGASEKITTDKNVLVLYQDDLFPGKTDYKAEDAKYVRLKAVITSLTGDIKFFNVKFRVWDKNNGNNVSGSYIFSLVK